MKYLILLLLIGCTGYTPLHKAGECFIIGPIQLTILEVNNPDYLIEVNAMGLVQQKINRPIKAFDEAVKEAGFVVEKCGE